MLCEVCEVCEVNKVIELRKYNSSINIYVIYYVQHDKYL